MAVVSLVIRASEPPLGLIGLKKILGFVMFGSTMSNAHQSEIRLINSVGQDICRAATRSQWKLPTHIFLSMTLWHLYGSKELTTLISRFGHCESYSFSLEVETANCNGLGRNLFFLVEPNCTQSSSTIDISLRFQ